MNGAASMTRSSGSFKTQVKARYVQSTESKSTGPQHHESSRRKRCYNYVATTVTTAPGCRLWLPVSLLQEELAGSDLAHELAALVSEGVHVGG